MFTANVAGTAGNSLDQNLSLALPKANSRELNETTHRIKKLSL